jgi:HEAT repeat protein
MKKIFFACLFAFLSINLFSQSEDTSVELESVVVSSKSGISKVPAAKRPLPVDSKKAEEARAKDESVDDEKNNRDTIKFGLASEINSLIDNLIKNDDPRFTEELYDLFQTSTNSEVQKCILSYFEKIKDPCLEDFAVEVLNDPYDKKADLVQGCFKYVAAVKCKDAVPAVLSLIETENQSYFNDALSALGEIGGAEDAVFLIEYLDRTDLTDAQRQSLMRVLGKMNAVETWTEIVRIVKDNDENLFVRMYAAESLGQMKKIESVPILIELLNETDPNLRQYAIKGLKFFPDVVEAKTGILQGIKDEHYKVRLESIKAAKEMKISEAVESLIYRAKNDKETVIKNESYSVIAFLNTKDGNDFLENQIADKKVSDSTKAKVVEVLLKENHAGISKIVDLTTECVKDDKRKSLRYAIGKELAKYKKNEFAQLCSLFLDSNDSQTISLGLDMYKNCRYPECDAYVQKVADSKKSDSNKKRAMKLLGIES